MLIFVKIVLSFFGILAMWYFMFLYHKITEDITNDQQVRLLNGELKQIHNSYKNQKFLLFLVCILFGFSLVIAFEYIIWFEI